MKYADIIKIFFTSPYSCSLRKLRIEKRGNTWVLVMYHTDIIKYDTETDYYAFNATKYAPTATRVQNEIKRHLPVKKTVTLDNCKYCFKF